MSEFKLVLEVIATIIVLIGVPVGVVRYFSAVKKEQLDREYGTYNALDEKYLEYQELCLQHPYLDVADVPDQAPVALTSEQRKQELIALTMLFAIFERAYLMYYGHSTGAKKRQWSGWNSYIQSFCKRENVRKAWPIVGSDFDKRFEKYIARFLPGARTQPPAETKGADHGTTG